MIYPRTSIVAVVVSILFSSAAHGQTGRCHGAREVVAAKTWEAIRYKYSPQYIADNKAELEKAVSGGANTFYNDCQANNLSDEQILLQGALSFAAMPIKKVADELLKGIGLPALGDKALHIDVKDIEKNGIWGGPNSFFRKPFG
jgi:hypothetical protein